MRILHILDHSPPLQSGYAVRTMSILKQQRALGWHTIQLTGPKQGKVRLPDRPIDGCHFFRTAPAGAWSALPVLRHAALVGAIARRLRHVAKLTRPDILHAHSPALNALAALMVGRRLGVPVVYEIRAFWEDAAVDHGTASEGSARYHLSRALETFAARRADAVTTICEGLRREILLRADPARGVTVIPNAVNAQHFKPNPLRDEALARELHLPPGPTIGFAGSFYAYEGLDLLLEAMPALLRAHPSLRLLLVGGGPREAWLRQRAQQLQLAGNVIFTGRLAHERMARIYTVIDILVYPRHRMRLTELVTPLKPLEAMAQGRVVLASDVGGHREMIEDGRTGVLFAAGDVHALVAALLALLGAPQRWQPLRDNARHFVETERSWASSVARYGPVYADLLARGQEK
ncbi:MAG: TIGR04063 family PEP-CTERM/XrtA system glycosyltransferase [Pseudomonadota bacterium]